MWLLDVMESWYFGACVLLAGFGLCTRQCGVDCEAMFLV